MAQASNNPASEHAEAAYPNPAGWEYMTHEERYAALRSERKPDTALLRNALLRAKQDVLQDQNGERRAFLEVRQLRTLADAPRFTLSLSGPSVLSLSNPSYSITATATYICDPASTPSTTQVARPVLFRPSYGPLSKSAPNDSLFSIYTTPTCTPESRIPHVRPNASIRPPREPDGSFTKDMEIKGWDEWAEAHLGNNVKREVAVGLDERSGWRQHLVLGRRYWLRCDEAGLLGVGKLGLDRFWRYGSMDTVELPFKIRLRDPEAVSIPLEASNTLEFAVEE